MKDSPLNPADITEIRRARNEAEAMRDRLMAEYRHLSSGEDADFFKQHIGEQRLCRGREAMRKAIVSANHAIACIDQALRQNERVQDEQ